MNLAVNVKLKVAEDDKKRLFQTFSAWKQAWQKVSDWSFANKLETDFKIAHFATYEAVRKEIPLLAANLVQSARTDALAKIKTIKKAKYNVAQAPQIKASYIQYDTRTSKIAGNTISLCVATSDKMSGRGQRIKVSFEPFPYFEKFRSQYRLKSPRIFYKNGEFWAAMNFEAIEGMPSSEKPILGIDLGQRNFVATSDGSLIKATKINRLKRKNAFLRKKLYAHGTKSARRHARRLRGKETRQTRDEVYCVVKRLMQKDASVFAIEDLKLKPSKGKGRKSTDANRRQRAVPYGMFKEIIKYKSAIHSKRVVVISPWMTSQYDCRGLKKGIRNKGRYTGVDGVVLNADINAACNIAAKAKHYLELNNPIPCAYPVSMINWQADVTQPIACQPCSETNESCNRSFRL